MDDVLAAILEVPGVIVCNHSWNLEGGLDLLPINKTRGHGCHQDKIWLLFGAAVAATIQQP